MSSRTPGRIAKALYRRINRSSTAGLTWKRHGDFITFQWDGYVAAPSIPLMFARHNHETKVIRDLMNSISVGRSLEVGCGFGRLSPVIAEGSSDHVAVDISAEALAVAKQAYPDIDFREGSVTSLPCRDASFDLVVSWTVVQHLSPTIVDEGLSEIKRVLRPGGRVLLCEETRSPGAPTRHSWHRDPSFYATRLAPLEMTRSFYIEEINSIPGLVSPGEVMLFEPATAFQ